MNFRLAAEYGNWHIVRPGLISLPTTGYEIEHNPPTSAFYVVRWKGTVVGQTTTSLSSAKGMAQSHLNDMLDMGYEP